MHKIDCDTDDTFEVPNNFIQNFVIESVEIPNTQDDIHVTAEVFKDTRGEFHRRSFFFKICSYTYNDIVYAYVKFWTDCMSASRVMKL